MAIRVEYTPMDSVGALAAQAGKAEASKIQAEIATRFQLQQMAQQHDMARMKFAADIEQANQAVEFERQAQLINMKKDMAMQLEAQDFAKKYQKFQMTLDQIDNSQYLSDEEREQAKITAYSKYSDLGDILPKATGGKMSPMDQVNQYRALKESGATDYEASSALDWSQPKTEKPQDNPMDLGLKQLDELSKQEFANTNEDGTPIDPEQDKIIKERKQMLYANLKRSMFLEKYKGKSALALIDVSAPDPEEAKDMKRKYWYMRKEVKKQYPNLPDSAIEARMKELLFEAMMGQTQPKKNIKSGSNKNIYQVLFPGQNQ